MGLVFMQMQGCSTPFEQNELSYDEVIARKPFNFAAPRFFHVDILLADINLIVNRLAGKSFAIFYELSEKCKKQHL